MNDESRLKPAPANSKPIKSVPIVLPQTTELLDPHHLLSAWASATARYWNTRAKVFELARPRPGDFHGAATTEQLAEQWDRLTAIAAACRARAHVSHTYGVTPVERALIVSVADALIEAA